MKTNVESDTDISKDKVILNEFLDCNLDDYIKGDIGDIPISPTLLNNKSDPLSEEKLDKTLDLINEIRLSLPQKTIWLYSGFTWENIFDTRLEKIIKKGIPGLSLAEECEETMRIVNKRRNIISQCDVLVDGQYIDSQRDITLKWRGNKNQRVINIQESLKQKQIVLYCD